MATKITTTAMTTQFTLRFLFLRFLFGCRRVIFVILRKADRSEFTVIAGQFENGIFEKVFRKDLLPIFLPYVSMSQFYPKGKNLYLQPLLAAKWEKTDMV